jgi:hypothetical protein
LVWLNDAVKEALFLANGTITIYRRKVSDPDLKLYGTAMTTAGIGLRRGRKNHHVQGNITEREKTIPR